MIIIGQTVGTGLTDLAVNENTFTSRTGLDFEFFEFDGNDWVRTTESPDETVDLADYGITFTGTPTTGDVISVAHQDSQYWVFYAGDGINCVKLNENFAALQGITNNNESAINTISTQALHKNGDNLEQSAIDAFKKDNVTVLSTSGTTPLTDGGDYFLTPTGNVTITLPTIDPDQYSHTISLVVAGSEYSVDLGTEYQLLGPEIDTENDYSVLFVYNHIDGHWYYYMGQ